jgi:hypothetical protein
MGTGKDSKQDSQQPAAVQKKPDKKSFSSYQAVKSRLPKSR